MADYHGLLKEKHHGANALANKKAAMRGAVNLGDLGSVEPISRTFGFDRGRCIDRYYIENFLRDHAVDIRGQVLEVAEDVYVRRFGGGAVDAVDVLHVDPSCHRATVVRDLADTASWPASRYDGIVLTQTLQHIYDSRAAVRTLQQILRPGGVLLLTVPGISQISRYDMDRWGDYWRFTDLSVRTLLEEVFEPDKVAVEAFGNVASASCFLHGLSADELTAEQLACRDEDYQLVIAARAVKEAAS